MLFESLNSSYKLDEIGSDNMLHQMGSMSAAMLGGTNFKLYKIQDNGYMIQYDKDNKTELHHVDENLMGGYLKNDVKPSLKFISTYKNKIGELLNDGKTVKISAHNVLADQLHSLTKRLIDKNHGYSTTDMHDETHEITGDKLKSWELKKD